MISSTALYNAAKHKGLRGPAHPTYGTSFETCLGQISENAYSRNSHNLGSSSQGHVERAARRASEGDHTVFTPRAESRNTKRELRFRALLSEGGSELSLAIV